MNLADGETPQPKSRNKLAPDDLSRVTLKASLSGKRLHEVAFYSTLG
jgi:hypothetical protein